MTVIVGSHNSMSYLPPKNLWGKITKPWGKCQSLNLYEQWKEGVRMFDIRVRMIGKTWHLVHNKVDYGKLDITELTKVLNDISDEEPNIITIRLGLDVRKTPKDDKEYTEKFVALAKLINQMTITNCIIDDCITFWNWKHIDFHIGCINTNVPFVVELHTSVCSDWYLYLKGTKWFAKKHNSESRAITNLNTDPYELKYLLIDYVQY